MKSRKQRIQRFALDFKGPAVITGLHQNADGTLTLLGPGGKPLQLPAGSFGLQYERRKGPKVTFDLPMQGLVLGDIGNALAAYDQIIGVDTNYCNHNDVVVCVTAICQLRDAQYDGPRWSGTVDALWALEFHDPTKPAERVGWRHALAVGADLGWFEGNRRTLLVVDAYRDELHRINQRTAPLIDDFLLPNGVALAYASSDVASDSPLNGLIARCDNLARSVLSRALDPTPGLSDLLNAERTPFRAHRFWQFEGGK